MGNLDKWGPIMISPYFYNFTLIRVIDGDTIVGNVDLGFNLSLNNQHVRLWGINTPEIKGETKSQGLNVRSFVIQCLTPLTPIIIQSHNFDSFGRLLATVYYGENNTNLNKLLLELEMAVKF